MTSHDELKRAAEAAIPSRIGGNRPAARPSRCVCQLCGSVFIGEPLHATCEGCEVQEAFHRLANPATVLSLLTESEALKGALGTANRMAEVYRSNVGKLGGCGKCGGLHGRGPCAPTNPPRATLSRAIQQGGGDA